MTKPLVVRGTVPLPSFPVFLYDGAVFLFWFPAEDRSIPFTDGDVTGKLWFDNTCTQEKPAPHDGKYHTGIQAHSVRVELTMPEVADELFAMMHTPTSDVTPQLKAEHTKCAEKMCTSFVRAVNRVIEFLRVERNQFWLASYPDVTDVADITLASFQVSILRDGTWGPCQRPGAANKVSMATPGDVGALSEQEWDQFAAFVGGNHRTDRSLEFLANADLLLKLNMRRSAIVELATAVETSVDRFAEAFDKCEPLRGKMRGLFPAGEAGLRRKIGQLGLRLTVRLVLPLLLPQGMVPDYVLTSVADAIEKRHEVVHSGTRDVSLKTDELIAFARNARVLCATLLWFVSMGAGIAKEGQELPPQP